MPTYGGGKASIGKEIWLAIKNSIGPAARGAQVVEPFCGLLGVTRWIEPEHKVRAFDRNKSLVLALNAIRDGWVPPRNPPDKDEYERLKFDIDSAWRGFVGVACAYSGIWFAGYRVASGRRNYYERCRLSLLETVRSLHSGVTIEVADYRQLKMKGCIVYCDPPYRGNAFTNEYFSGFDSDTFWKTMEEWSRDNFVFVSEYEAPAGWTCIWEKKSKGVFNGCPKVATERVFTRGRYQ